MGLALNTLDFLKITGAVRQAFFLQQLGVAKENNDVTFIINPSETTGPAVAAFEAGRLNSGVLVPLCPYSFMINKSFLQIFFPWVAEKVVLSHVLVADYIERHNIMLKTGCSEQDALKKAKDISIKEHDKIVQLVAADDISSSFEFIDLFDIAESDLFINILKSIKLFATDNSHFNSHIKSLSLRYLQKNVPGSADSVDALDRASMYVHEEVAMYLYLNSKGWHTEIYPGADLQILREIFNGTYDDFPINTGPRTHISVSLQK